MGNRAILNFHGMQDNQPNTAKACDSVQGIAVAAEI
jgi:hypothetical protein